MEASRTYPPSQGVTNWGREDMIPDLTPDDDSINIVVFYKVEPSPGAINHTIAHTLEPGTDTAITGEYKIETQASDLTVRTSSFLQAIKPISIQTGIII